MMKNLFTPIILFLFLPLFSFGQADVTIQKPAEYCGSEFNEVMKERQDNILRIMRSGNYKRSNVVRYVPLTIHLIGKSDGTLHYDQVETLDRLCELNEQYMTAGTDIQFYLADNEDGGIQKHNNDSWYDGGATNTMELFTSEDNTINMYIVGSSLSGGTVVCGFYTPAEDIVVIGKGCYEPNNTTAMHELGHFLTLPHTFSGWEGTPYSCGTVVGPNREKMDGSNCETVGDRFCDTGPDYLSNRWTCGGNGQSTCLHMDADSTTFYPSGRNAMSYSNDFCVSEFSVEQSSAMNIDLDSRMDLASSVTFSEVSGSAEPIWPSNASTTPFGSIYFVWEQATNATDYVLQVSTTATFSNIISEQFVDTYNTTVTGDFSSLTTYYWRVRAYNKTHTCANYSSTNIFTTTALEVGTGEIAGVNSFASYPNPVIGGQDITLDIQSTQKMDGFVRLYNVQGQLIASEPMSLQNGQAYHQVATQDLATGIYLLSLDFPGGAIREKIVVSK